MTRLLALLAVLFLPIFRGGYVVSVSGEARWGPRELGIGPVAHRWFALLEVISEKPRPIARHSSKSPHARTDAEGRFAFWDVEDGMYVLAIESHPPFNWDPVWPPEENAMVLVVVEGESVELGTVRVGVRHQWGDE